MLVRPVSFLFHLFDFLMCVVMLDMCSYVVLREWFLLPMHFSGLKTYFDIYELMAVFSLYLQLSVIPISFGSLFIVYLFFNGSKYFLFVQVFINIVLPTGNLSIQPLTENH